MTQYLLSVYEFGTPPAPEDLETIYADVNALNEKMKAAEVWVFAGGLHPPEKASVVKMVNCEPVVSHGPFIETNERLGGFWIIEANDLVAALDWATAATVACRLPIEVRPFQENPEV
jgi:hypothetical protein